VLTLKGKIEGGGTPQPTKREHPPGPKKTKRNMRGDSSQAQRFESELAIGRRSERREVHWRKKDRNANLAQKGEVLR